MAVLPMIIGLLVNDKLCSERPTSEEVGPITPCGDPGGDRGLGVLMDVLRPGMLDG